MVAIVTKMRYQANPVPDALNGASWYNGVPTLVTKKSVAPVAWQKIPLPIISSKVVITKTMITAAMSNFLTTASCCRFKKNSMLIALISLTIARNRRYSPFNIMIGSGETRLQSMSG